MRVEIQSLFYESFHRNVIFLLLDYPDANERRLNAKYE